MHNSEPNALSRAASPAAQESAEPGAPGLRPPDIVTVRATVPRVAPVCGNAGAAAAAAESLNCTNRISRLAAREAYTVSKPRSNFPPAEAGPK